MEVFLNIGKGYSAMEIFSMNLGIPPVDRRCFDKYDRKVDSYVEECKSVR